MKALVALIVFVGLVTSVEAQTTTVIRSRVRSLTRSVLERPLVRMWDPALGVLSAGRRYRGALVVRSPVHPVLMRYAERHARYQARVQLQGHQNWESRMSRLRYDIGNYQFAEICAESWSWQVNETMDNLGWEMFKCWEYSPGHWSVASRQYRYVGSGMALGRNGIWYACIIVAD